MVIGDRSTTVTLNIAYSGSQALLYVSERLETLWVGESLQLEGGRICMQLQSVDLERGEAHLEFTQSGAKEDWLNIRREEAPPILNRG